MSTPGQPNDPGFNNPYNPGGQPGQPGQPGYPSQQGGYPTQQGYPGQQGGYPTQGGYPGQQGGYPTQGGYPGQQAGYPGPAPYPGGPAGYQGFGSYPGGAGLPPEPIRPNTVTFAFWCWIATTVVSLVGLAITLTSPIWDVAAAAGARQTGTNIDVDSIITTVKIFTVVVALVFVAVYLLFAFKMHQGRNWARIVLTVGGALTLLSAFTPTSRSVTVNSVVYDVTSGQWASYLTAALAVAGIVLMFLAPSNKFFTDSKGYKQAKRQIGA